MLVAQARAQDYPAATLYVVATPIGNRADITIRALTCLSLVDAIAAEDTRVTRPLLRAYGIDKPMIAAHRHNENQAAEAIVARLVAGDRIAYVSDAGTPGISDPGATLVRAALASGHRVVPIAGVSALTAALSVAGLPEGPITFVGFLPSRAMQAKRLLSAHAGGPAHLVLFEAPHRIAQTLALLAETFGPDRLCVVAREITKRFETIERTTLPRAAALVQDGGTTRPGEYVVIIEASGGDDDRAALERARPALERLVERIPVSEAASLVAELTGLSRKALYAEALRFREGGFVDAAPDD